MKKLIEFQEVKHEEIINIIAKFRVDNNTTFSEAVRRLILCSQNGNCPTNEEECLDKTQEDRIITLEHKLDVVISASKAFKKYMENNSTNSEDRRTTSEYKDEE